MESIEVRELDLRDIAALVQCFQRCYGDTYVGESFHDPERLAAVVRAGRLRSVVAATATGEIVGHMALTIRGAAATTADAGNTVVDPRYRGHNLAARLAARLIELCRAIGYVGFHHYPTTAHPIMQQLAVRGGGIETGILFAFIPASTRYREIDVAADRGRHAVTAVYQPLAPAAHRRIFIPTRYRHLIEPMLSQADLSRGREIPTVTSPPAATALHTSFDARRGLLRIDVEQIGCDLGERVRDTIGTTDAEVVHLDLPLSDTNIEAAIEPARACGFFFAALLPEYRPDDVLRLQLLRGSAATITSEVFATDGGRRLCTEIERDRNAR